MEMGGEGGELTERSNIDDATIANDNALDLGIVVVGGVDSVAIVGAERIGGGGRGWEDVWIGKTGEQA